MSSAPPIHPEGYPCVNNPFHPDGRFDYEKRVCSADLLFEQGTCGFGDYAKSGKGGTLLGFNRAALICRVPERVNDTPLVASSVNAGTDAVIALRKKFLGWPKSGFQLILLAVKFSLFSSAAADELPMTLMTKPGKLLVAEDFSKALPPPEGNTTNFASGFRGWRRNVVSRGGRWEVVDGAFKGIEDPAAHHPATTSLGFDFTDVVIECEVRMHDVPGAGRTGRIFMIRATDEKDYVCSIIFNPSGWRVQKDDNDRGGPDKSVPFGKVDKPIKLGEWQKVVFEILGEEVVGTVNGQSLSGRHALIKSGKKSVMFVSGVEGSVRNLRIWQALPNPDWEQNRAKLSPQL